MMAVSVNPSSSRAPRMAATRPSIMSDGATMSAPASACVIAILASSSSVMSLLTSPFWITPQCPWSMYSHRHTSVITTRSGVSSLMALTAICTVPSGSYALVPEEALRHVGAVRLLGHVVAGRLVGARPAAAADLLELAGAALALELRRSRAGAANSGDSRQISGNVARRTSPAATSK